jgi:hypothetical protein
MAECHGLARGHITRRKRGKRMYVCTRNLPFIFLIALALLSLQIFHPSAASAQYQPRSESLPGLSNEAVILGGVLIAAAVILAVVIVSKSGSSEEEETAPADSADTSLLNHRGSCNIVADNYLSARICIKSRSHGEHNSSAVCFANSIEPVCIVRDNEFLLGLHVQF